MSGLAKVPSYTLGESGNAIISVKSLQLQVVPGLSRLALIISYPPSTTSPKHETPEEIEERFAKATMRTFQEAREAFARGEVKMNLRMKQQSFFFDRLLSEEDKCKV